VVEVLEQTYLLTLLLILAVALVVLDKETAELMVLAVQE
jgi:hypothetical protein